MDRNPDPRPFDTEALLAHAGWVRRLAHSLVPADAHLADDLAQQTYLAALENAPSTDRSLAAWLATVLRNLVRQERRGSGRRSARERAVARDEAQPAHDTTLAVHNELVQAVMSLDEPFRETIVLRFFEELQPSAIAWRQGVPVATVKSRLARAIAELRRKLDRSHGSDGRNWIAALVPYCRPEGGVAAATMGALIVSAKLKIVAAVVIVCALAAVWAVRTSRSTLVEEPVAKVPAPSVLDAVSKPTPALDAEANPAGRASAAPSATVAQARDLDLLIVDEAGSALANTPVLLLDANRGSQTTSTDEHGHAGFLARPGRGALFLHRADDAPRRVEVDTSAGTHRVEIPPMPELSGVVHENGRAPTTPIRLFLISRERVFPNVELPQEVRAFLGMDEDERYTCNLSTALDGTFRFTGLPSTWSGRVILPPTWTLADNQRTIAGAQVVVVGAPAQNLVIDVEHLPHLLGRIVDAAMQPVARAQVSATIKWIDGTSNASTMRSGPDGRFELRLNQPDIDQVSLDVHGPDGHGSALRFHKRGEISPGFDYGDIALVIGPTLRLHVIRAGGEPVAGAVAVAERSKEKYTTNATGDCAVPDLAADASYVRVLAKGYTGVFVPLSAPGPELVSVVLRPCNRLTIDVHGPNGRPPGAIRLSLSAGEALLFPETRSAMIETLIPERIVGKSVGTRYDALGKGEARFQPDANGRLSIESVVTATPLQLRIGDSLGHVAREMTIAPLGEDEDRRVEVVLASAARAISGLVHDETGAPVPGARVECSAERSDTAWAKTDADGRFRFDPTFADEITLGVTKEEFALIRLRNVRIPDPPADIVLTLEHGRRVKVSVVDTRSRPVEGGNLNAFDPESSSGWPATLLGPGQYEVPRMPSHEIRLQLYLAGKQYEISHDPHIAEARIEVPVHGRVIVTWSTEKPGKHMVQLQASESDLGPILSVESEKSDGETVFENVLPGQYQVSILDTGQPPKSEKAGPSQTLTVEADKTVRVTVRP